MTAPGMPVKTVEGIFAKLGIESTGQEHRRVLAVLTALGNR